MTDQPAPERNEPPYWWHGADGAKIIRQVWKAIEDVSKHGVETMVRFQREGEPTLTIAFDWDEPDDENLAEGKDGVDDPGVPDDAADPYDPSDFPPQPSAAEEAIDDDDEDEGF